MDVFDLLSVNIFEQVEDLYFKVISMSYDGYFVVVVFGGVFVFDWDFMLCDYMFFLGEYVENGIVIDEKCIYVMISKHMYGLVWDGESLFVDEVCGGW